MSESVSGEEDIAEKAMKRAVSICLKGAPHLKRKDWGRLMLNLSTKKKGNLPRKGK